MCLYLKISSSRRRDFFFTHVCVSSEHTKNRFKKKWGIYFDPICRQRKISDSDQRLQRRKEVFDSWEKFVNSDVVAVVETNLDVWSFINEIEEQKRNNPVTNKIVLVDKSLFITRRHKPLFSNKIDSEAIIDTALINAKKLGWDEQNIFFV